VVLCVIAASDTAETNAVQLTATHKNFEFHNLRRLLSFRVQFFSSPWSNGRISKSRLMFETGCGKSNIDANDHLADFVSYDVDKISVAT
jgi:hypothetical protein